MITDIVSDFWGYSVLLGTFYMRCSWQYLHIKIENLIEWFVLYADSWPQSDICYGCTQSEIVFCSEYYIVSVA
jgi:hypothetical protein